MNWYFQSILKKKCSGLKGLTIEHISWKRTGIVREQIWKENVKIVENRTQAMLHIMICKYMEKSTKVNRKCMVIIKE